MVAALAQLVLEQYYRFTVCVCDLRLLMIGNGLLTAKGRRSFYCKLCKTM